MSQEYSPKTSKKRSKDLSLEFLEAGNLARPLKSSKSSSLKKKVFSDSLLDLNSTIRHDEGASKVVNLSKQQFVFNAANADDVDASVLEVQEIMGQFQQSEDDEGILSEISEEKNDSDYQPSHVASDEDHKDGGEESTSHLNIGTMKPKRYHQSYKPELKVEFLHCYIRRKRENEGTDEESRKRMIEAINKELNSNVIYHTAKGWILAYEKDPAFLHILEQDEHQVKGKKKKRIPKNVLYSEDLDQELVDYVHYHRDKGVYIYPKNFKDFALQLIKPTCPKFVASPTWFANFQLRHDLSLKTPNIKVPQSLPADWQELKSSFVAAVRDTIEKHDIHPDLILNMDETPLFYEYLPKKVLHRTAEKDVVVWKSKLDKKKATLILTVSATGIMLEPGLVLKRKTKYNLPKELNNKINLKFYNSEKGWVNQEIMKSWLEDVLIPYVDGKKALLLLDSYGCHYGEQVRTFLKNHTNIIIGIIPGGLTSQLQPLDLCINAKVKAFIKECSYKHLSTGGMKNLEALEKEKTEEQRETTVSKDLIVSEENLIIATVDQNRLITNTGSKKKVVQSRKRRIDYTKVDTEILYRWIEGAIVEMRTQEGSKCIRSGWKVYQHVV